jgi:hypothetical protein
MSAEATMRIELRTAAYYRSASTYHPEFYRGKRRAPVGERTVELPAPRVGLGALLAGDVTR